MIVIHVDTMEDTEGLKKAYEGLENAHAPISEEAVSSGGNTKFGRR